VHDAVLLVAAAVLSGVWLWSRRNPMTAENVNDYVDPADRAIDDSEHAILEAGSGR
jgi:hypothetical protein